MFMHITINSNILNVKFWRKNLCNTSRHILKTYISSLTEFLHNWVEYIMGFNEIKVKNTQGWMNQRGMHNGRVK